jgi:dTDP-4-amino-4,6-dideoxygalactose transaminase
VLSLPMFPELRDAEIDVVVSALSETLEPAGISS